MNYYLFILINGALFIRPSEIAQTLSAIPVYNIFILSSLTASLGPLFEMVKGPWLREQPTSFCVFGLLIIIFLSNAARFDVGATFEHGFDFAKITVYYTLLIVILNSPSRLAGFLRCLMILTLILTIVALLNYYDYITIESLALTYRLEEGSAENIVQLTATGIFSDPNDFCSILGVSILIGVSTLADTRRGMIRFFWIIPVAIYAWAFLLTRSRGGLLGLLAGLATFFVARFGWRRAIFLGVLAFPAFFVLVGGRQTRISTGEDTALSRMEFWLEGFRMLVRSPLFGVGAGQFVEHVGHVAHNSFIQASAELGVAGGLGFLGIFFFPFWSLLRLSPQRATISDPNMRRLRPYLMAMIMVLFVSLMSITRNYTVTTYLIPGVVTSYLRIIRHAPPDAIPRTDLRSLVRLTTAYVGVMLCLFALVRSSIH